MQRVRTAPFPFGNLLSRAFVRLMRLDAPPMLERLPANYRTAQALPFLFDAVRSVAAGRVLLVIAAAVMSQIMFSLQPYALSRMIDALNAELEGLDDGTATIWVVVLFGLWIGGPFFFQLAQLINVYLVPVLRAAIKAWLFQHLMGHSPHFFQANFPGRLSQKANQAANSAHRVVNSLTIDGVQTVILMMTSSLLLGSLSGVYGWALAIWVVVFLGLTAWLGSFGIELFRKLQNAASKVSGRMVDTINNWELVRGFAGLDRERHVLEDALAEEAARSRRARLFFVGMAIMHVALGMLLLIWLILSALAEARAGRMTLGEFIMVCTLSANVVMVVRLLGRRMVDFFAD
ncbi:MAG: ABC transporter ATP-binding protein/permease, partial [Alphaproteobacteria bacterium]|nr:ABC transporter ATP-binding protein/permease [Alphaproteobacteria bacterium]